MTEFSGTHALGNERLTDSPKAKPTEIQSELNSSHMQLEQLHKTIEELNGVIGDAQGRFASVIGPSRPTDTGSGAESPDKESEPSTDLGKNVRTLRNQVTAAQQKVFAITSRVRDIIQRCELPIS